MTTGNLAELERELERFPSSVVDEFRRAVEKISPKMDEFDLVTWGRQGVTLAQQTVRSWEAASEYFRVSPEVLEILTSTQIIDWAQHGTVLCEDSPSLAVAYFRSSPKALRQLKPRYIQGWSMMGRGFYRGTWKSSALAAKFFEVSGNLLETSTYEELERIVDLIDYVSHKSSDLATECLVLGEQIFPRLGKDRLAFVRLARSVGEANWREVKGAFESMPRMLNHVQEGQRDKFLALATDVAQNGMPNIALFLSESSISLGRVNAVAQDQFLEMAQSLVSKSHESAAAFLRNAPSLLNRISLVQVEAWFQQGSIILDGNPDGGLAYFRVESNTSEEAIEALSSAVELERISGVLRMYCRGLAGADIDIASTQDVMSKKIGWVSEDHATTEGTTVYLPAEVNSYGSKEANFSLFKVVSTHQIGHIEFGSFHFQFEEPATRFGNNRRMSRENELQEQRAGLVSQANKDENEDHNGEDPQDQNVNGGVVSAERGFLTDMGRFFDLFIERRLAQDIFTVIEDARLDFRIKSEYRGIASDYRRIQEDALGNRPEIQEMPLQEAMVEFLVRFSLNQYQGLPVPTEFIDHAMVIAEVAKRLLHTDATVEDTSEATIRIYDIVSDMPNMQMDEEDWSDMDLDEEEISDEQLENLLEEFGEMSSSGDMGSDGEESYQSPPQVDFRGDFKPELSQIISSLRQQGEGGEQAQGMEITQEMLEQMLADSPELELDAESGEANPDLQMFIQNLVREAGAQQKEKEPGQGYGPIPHEGEEGGSLEPVEPKSFVYDEWDFRAGDYKPRWCIVREKPLAEGDTQFYMDTVHSYGRMLGQIRKQFEMLMPEDYRKIKHLPDGDDFDLDAVIESIIDKWAGESPSDKVHWRRNKVERDVAVAFLLDMSASTAEAIDEARRLEEWDAPDDPVEYMVWLRSRRGEGARRAYKRIIDLEKESIVLLIHALETTGDTYGIYGFSGYGRENVEFYVIKDVDETFGERIKRRVDKVSPLHATRMGPAIRHTTSKLEKLENRTKLMILISDGRPQDRGYSREGVEKEYAVHDTKMAFTEARRKGITPFALTVDKAGHDYLATMCQDMGYEVLSDLSALPSRLPMLYRKLTF